MRRFHNSFRSGLQKHLCVVIDNLHSYCEYMKNITVSVDDEVYYAARVEAAKQRTSVSALVRGYFQWLSGGEWKKNIKASDPELAKLFAMSDRKHRHRRGSVGPLNREEIYQRGIPRH